MAASRKRKANNREPETGQSNRAKGAAGFEAYYGALYGVRWSTLRTALVEPPAQVAFTDGLLKPYYLDAASLAAARALPLESAAEPDAPLRVLDLCSAPGGKALVLATRLAPNGSLIANERSAARRGRLHRVLDEHLPQPVRKCIQITGHDARRWGLHEQEAYDAVLLDAPCSSERHVLNSSKQLAQWSSKRPQRLAAEQNAMLQAALTALRPGGWVLYVTCALTTAENDAVLTKAIRRRRGTVSPVPLTLPGGEPTEHGVHVLPDAAAGEGPLYAALLHKHL